MTTDELVNRWKKRQEDQGAIPHTDPTPLVSTPPVHPIIVCFRCKQRWEFCVCNGSIGAQE